MIWTTAGGSSSVRFARISFRATFPSWTCSKGGSTMLDNILLLTDSYKVSHWKQYPAGTTRVFSFLESRGGEFAETTFFGLQYIIARYLTGPVVTRTKIEEAAAVFEKHFGNPALFNREGWEHILNIHGGRLPVTIKAVPEGTTVPTGNVLMTIENTD